MTINDIVKQAIDIHVHIGPEIIPRKYDVSFLVKNQEGKLGGAVLKNHFYATSPLLKKVQLHLFGSIVLNNYVGGLNAQAVYAASIISNQPIMVWFPTINAENFLRQSEYEIAPEWVKQKDFVATKSKDVHPIIVVKNNKLIEGAIKVLRMIKYCDAVLATGHISWKESQILVKEAISIGIKNIVITHPIYQRIQMPVALQKDLAKKGCFMEQCYSMYSIDKIPISQIAEQIKEIGSKSVILSSDVGQTFSPPPNVALTEFCQLLEKEGIRKDELFTMLVINPRKLLGIDKN